LPQQIVVFGAGAFGGWTALELLRRGARVRLVDPWGPGNPRASSGGETRVIRATYGSHEIYTAMAARSLRLWRAHEERFQQQLLRLTGALWMFGRDNPFVGISAAALGRHGLALHSLSVADARRRYPQIDFSGISSTLVEPEAGYLFARRACEHVAEVVIAEGGEYIVGSAAAPVGLSGPARSIRLADGSDVAADAFVFACGPWLGALFPDVVGGLVAATRQEVYYFRIPPAPGAGLSTEARSAKGERGALDVRFSGERLPVWLEFGDRFIYGIPGDAEAGFKAADDTPGPPIDPTSDPRTPTESGVCAMSAFLARRFPDLAGAPLQRAEVCQYESTPDAHFIIDRHPRASNVWFAGGGSGHGFKMGPAIGQIVASLVLGDSAVDPAFGLARFATPPARGWKAKWS
jgi:glycine/D-amino acid oxidase-like deaminating enzyme